MSSENSNAAGPAMETRVPPPPSGLRRPPASERQETVWFPEGPVGQAPR